MPAAPSPPRKTSLSHPVELGLTPESYHSS
uniref:Uncharacterized protein n=1 Tax=Rhizophora mucronata TaxID=61149 RepID=A0A2P2Q492_RHIMU